jgi:hypothetical protein
MSHTQLHSRLTEAAITFGVAALVLTLALGTAAAVAAPSTHVAAADSQASADSTDATVQAAIDDAPDGLAGFKVRLSVDAGTVAGASYPDHYQPTTDPIVSADGQSVTIEAADLEDAVTDGASNVSLATVPVDDLDGQAPNVSVDDAQLDADGGDRIDPESLRLAVDGPTVGQERTPPADGGAEGSAADSGAALGGAAEDPRPDGEDSSATGPRLIGVAVVGVAMALLVVAALARYAGRE